MAVARPHRVDPPARRGLRVRVLAWPHRAARVAIAVVLMATMSLSTAGDIVGPVDAGIAPACRYADVLTRYRGQGDWYRSLLDTKYRLASTSAPSDLVAANRSGASGYGSIRRVALADLTAMYRAAKAYGAPFAIQSAYRSYRTQAATFTSWVRKMGYAKALLASARAGHSEHQLGTALDLQTPGGAAPWYYSDWGTTKTGAWLARNSWRYGWVLSYPKGKSPSATCYKYEPWHFRYVGRAIAARIRASGLAPREWLYLKGATTTWVGGLPNPTPKPTATPTPSPTESPSPSPSEMPSPGPSESPSPSPSESTSPSAIPGETPSASAGETPLESPADIPSEATSGAPSESSPPPPPGGEPAP